MRTLHLGQRSGSPEEQRRDIEAIKPVFWTQKITSETGIHSYDEAGLVKLIHLVAKGGAIYTKVSLGSLLYITITENVAQQSLISHCSYLM